MKTHVRHPVKKIIWAVDAFENAAFFQKRAAQILGFFSTLKESVTIEPVFVMNFNQSNVPPDFVNSWGNTYHSSAEGALKEKLSRFALPFLKPPVVLEDAVSSIPEGVDVLSDHASKVGADLILVNSHGRSGFKRFLLGSFAETLLHRSRVPVLVVGQKNKLANKLERIVFPTEFGEHSKELFREAIDLAKKFEARITLAHMIPKPKERVLDYDYPSRVYLLGGERLTFAAVRERQIQHQMRRAQAWSEWASHAGVNVEVLIDIESDTVAEGILKLSKGNRGGEIIMMEAQSEPVRDLDLGSTTKKVVRASGCPVWVFTSRYVEELFQTKLLQA